MSPDVSPFDISAVSIELDHGIAEKGQDIRLNYSASFADDTQGILHSEFEQADTQRIVTSLLILWQPFQFVLLPGLIREIGFDDSVKSLIHVSH
ncbi:hypothetical protein RRG08_001111 [Elysia crispata]|uniref:Uncharacterized protein n=1 Tax=Elysia crispata TaxID=231223 RepID=A0AAE1AWA1_9GAST|nr:hypothetical protein RRG08_001111 [Elysia crispata]